MCDAQDVTLECPVVRIHPIDGERVEVTARGTRNEICEVLGAPNSVLDWQSDAVAAIRYALEHDNLKSGTKLLFNDVLDKVPQ
jgi:hypothetical protein